MTAAARVHGSRPRALLTVVGLGTAAVAGAAIAVAMNTQPGSHPRRRSSARGHAVPLFDPTYSRDADGSGLFV